MGLVVLGATTLGCTGAGRGQADIRLDPVEVTARAPSELQPVSFIVGCWRGSFEDGGTVIDERWSAPEGGLMLGTTRFLRDGKVTGWEFGHLASGPDGIVYTPYPGGNRSEHAFRRTEGEPGRVVFEAPEHDYPKRIRYELGRDEVLRVAIDGGASDPSPRAWTLRRATCGISGTEGLEFLS